MSEWQRHYSQGPLEEPAGEWFVNRLRDLDSLWKWTSGIPQPGPRRSYALVGGRRTGKTAILHKLFNRLFHEQEQVMPIYVSFVQYLHRSEHITAFEFAEEYFSSYLRSYLAFRYDMPKLFASEVQLEYLRNVVNQQADELALEWLELYDITLSSRHMPGHNIMQWVINFPKGYALRHKMPTIIFIDEFQVLTRVYNSDEGLMRDLTDSFQRASEAQWAPLLVSGSSISMLQGQALGGLLSGRFTSFPVKQLESEYAVELAFRLSKHLDMPMTEELAEAIYEMTGGYPYSIERILFSESPDKERLPDVDALSDVLFFELNNELGALGKHYEEEYGKYVRELNGDQITRKILHWITNQAELHIHPRKVAEALSLDFLQVQEALEKLYKADVIDRASISTFWGPSDPLMCEYLQYAHYIDIDDLTLVDAAAKLQAKLREKQGEFNRKTGHFTEIIVGGVMKQYDWRTVDGEPYFNRSGEVNLPRFYEIRRREGVIKAGKIHEIDLIGEYTLSNQQAGSAGLGAWMVAVRYRKQRMSKSAVEEFIRDVVAVQAEKQYGEIIRWYFSQSGFTEDAKQRLKAEGIYFSDVTQFNRLVDLFELLNLSM